MAKDEITPVIEKAAGRKPKVKNLDEVPTDTKSKKLDPKIRKAFEEAFPKAKLQHIRIHSGGSAKDACKSLNAKAFAYGNDIFFASPSFAKDVKFVAHELAHIVQQKGRVMPPKTGKVLTTK